MQGILAKYMLSWWKVYFLNYSRSWIGCRRDIVQGIVS